MFYCRIIMLNINVKELPRPVLEQAVKLRDPLKNIYLALFQLGKPSAAKKIAEEVGYARAHTHMRLMQLEAMGIVKRHRKGRNIKFEVIKCP